MPSSEHVPSDDRIVFKSLPDSDGFLSELHRIYNPKRSPQNGLPNSAEKPPLNGSVQVQLKRLFEGKDRPIDPPQK